MEDSSTRSWEQIADDWVRHADGDVYRNEFLMPTMLSMLGEVGHRRIIDLGCGEGGYARMLAKNGAQVTGIDGSQSLIAVARDRAKAAGLSIAFDCCNANSLTGLDSASFDICLASMSLMDVEDYRGAVAEICRVLMKGGKLAMSILHPCFTQKGAGWVRDDQGRNVHYSVDDYFGKNVWEQKITREFAHPVAFRHRPLESYVGPLISAGLVLSSFLEPTPEEELVRRFPRLSIMKRIPYFLFMEWRKA